MREVYFPVGMDHMGAKIIFLHTSANHLSLDEAFVRAIKHNHPAAPTAIAFRMWKAR